MRCGAAKAHIVSLGCTKVLRGWALRRHDLNDVSGRAAVGMLDAVTSRWSRAKDAEQGYHPP